MAKPIFAGFSFNIQPAPTAVEMVKHTRKEYGKPNRDNGATVGSAESGPYQLDCTIGEAMLGYICMVDAPYFAKTRTSARQEGGSSIQFLPRVSPTGS